MAVNRHQLMNELELRLRNDSEVTDNVAEYGDFVAQEWKHLAKITLTAGYWTGEYSASIHRESVRAPKSQGGNRGGWRTGVVNRSDHAHFIEYGTDADDAPNYPDPPNEGGHWTDPEGVLHFSWMTPTPVFALAAQIENDFNSTTAALPKSKGARRRVKNGTRKSRSRLRMEAGE